MATLVRVSWHWWRSCVQKYMLSAPGAGSAHNLCGELQSLIQPSGGHPGIPQIGTKWTQKRLIKLIHCVYRSESFYHLDKSENEKMKLTASPFWGKSNLENKITAHSEHKGTYLLWHLRASSLPKGSFLNDGLYAVYNPRSNIVSISLTLKQTF